MVDLVVLRGTSSDFGVVGVVDVVACGGDVGILLLKRPRKKMDGRVGESQGDSASRVSRTENKFEM